MKKITAIGRVTKDAELQIRKVGETEVPVTNFFVAVNTRRPTAERDEKTGKRKYETDTEYIKVTLWRDHAKAMTPYLTKARLVSLDGEFTLETWLDRNNQVHPVAHLTSPIVELLGKNPEKEEVPTETTVAAAPVDVDELPFD